MATERGQDGVVTTPGGDFAALRRWQLTGQAQAIRTTVCRQAAETFRPGLVEWVGVAEGLFDYGDPGQKALLDAMLLEPRGLLVFISLGNEVTGYTWLNQAVLVTQVVTTSPLDDLVGVVLSFRTLDDLWSPPELHAQWDAPFEPEALPALSPQWEGAWDAVFGIVVVEYWTAPWDAPTLPTLSTLYEAPWDAPTLPTLSTLYEAPWES